MTLLLPVFFVVVGLATRVAALDRPYLWGAGRAGDPRRRRGQVGRIDARRPAHRNDVNMIGVLMNTRRLTELVILNAGLELGVINPTVCTVMVVMALTTTLWRHRSFGSSPAPTQSAEPMLSGPLNLHGGQAAY